MNFNEDDQDEDFIPDYEEVHPVQVQQLRQSLMMNSEEIFQLMMRKKKTLTTTHGHHGGNNLANSGKVVPDRNADNKATEERIMASLIYCIHKVS